MLITKTFFRCQSNVFNSPGEDAGKQVNFYQKSDTVRCLSYFFILEFFLHVDSAVLWGCLELCVLGDSLATTFAFGNQHSHVQLCQLKHNQHLNSLVTLEECDNVIWRHKLINLYVFGIHFEFRNDKPPPSSFLFTWFHSLPTPSVHSAISVSPEEILSLSMETIHRLQMSESHSFPLCSDFC